VDDLGAAPDQLEGELRQLDHGEWTVGRRDGDQRTRFGVLRERLGHVARLIIRIDDDNEKLGLFRQLLELGTVDELVSRRFHERAVHFSDIAGLEDPQMRGFPGVKRVAHEDGEVLLYTADVPATIGAVLAAADALAAPPHDLSVRRASLEDVFLDLTGHALRD
jgi:hypothetical protein